MVRAGNQMKSFNIGKHALYEDKHKEFTAESIILSERKKFEKRFNKIFVHKDRRTL